MVDENLENLMTYSLVKPKSYVDNVNIYNSKLIVNCYLTLELSSHASFHARR